MKVIWLMSFRELVFYVSCVNHVIFKHVLLCKERKCSIPCSKPSFIFLSDLMGTPY